MQGDLSHIMICRQSSGLQHKPCLHYVGGAQQKNSHSLRVVHVAVILPPIHKHAFYCKVMYFAKPWSLLRDQCSFPGWAFAPVCFWTCEKSQSFLLREEH
jgi:hypothetical protein